MLAGRIDHTAVPQIRQTRKQARFLRQAFRFVSLAPAAARFADHDTRPMSNDNAITNLEQVLDRLELASDDTRDVSLEKVMDALGRRSFAPLLLVAGLVVLAPGPGDIPGVPTIVAVVVLLTAGQLLLRRSELWLPQWLLRRSIDKDKLCKAIGWLRPPSRFIDRWLQPRLPRLTHDFAIAAACVVIAAVLPFLEVVPFSANVAGAALTAFALSLIAHDGLLALIAWGFTAATLGLGIYHLF